VIYFLETVSFNIDGKDIVTTKGKSVLEASLDAGIYIPHLCYHPDLPSVDTCRLCVVKIGGMEGFPTSCTTPAENGMVVNTKTEQVLKLRQQAMEKILAGHPADCGTCIKYLNCELQALKQYMAMDQMNIQRYARLFPVDSSNPLFVFDPNRCVECTRCVRACKDLRGVGILTPKKRGDDTYIGTAEGKSLADSGCRFCGACAEVCPTGAILDKGELPKGKNRKTSLVPCRYTCPAEIDVPGYLRFIREKNYAAAVALIREKVPFPVVLGYVCDQPCEDVCRRGELSQPISIRELKRFVAENDREKIWQGILKKKPPTGKKIAVIGSGPAGLTAAYYLVKQGHQVTVFEALSMAGGMLRWGIPEYRLPRHVLDLEIKEIENAGVEITTGACIRYIDSLFEQGFNAVLIAVGTHQGQRLSIPGSSHENVLIGVDFLRNISLGKHVGIGHKVLVLGGGNVAFDCARMARRLGAEQVHIACLESRDSLTASVDEVRQGEEEGIVIYPSRTFTRIVIENGKIRGVECQEVASFSFDEDKNLQIEIRENSLHLLEADTVIFAIGQKPEIPEGFKLAVTANHLIELDFYSYATSQEGVFAAGDAVNGTSSVIKAVASGRKAAMAIDRFLQGSGNIEEKLVPQMDLEKDIGPCEGFSSCERYQETCIKPEERLKSLCKVVCDIDEATALAEAKRCLQCDLRLKITPVKFWSEY
jgi:formate dehydrogenase (NADP+) beta subunit